MVKAEKDYIESKSKCKLSYLIWIPYYPILLDFLSRYTTQKGSKPGGVSFSTKTRPVQRSPVSKTPRKNGCYRRILFRILLWTHIVSSIEILHLFDFFLWIAKIHSIVGSEVWSGKIRNKTSTALKFIALDFHESIILPISILLSISTLSMLKLCLFSLILH